MQESSHQDDKQWLLSRLERLNNYLILKLGVFVICSVYALADFYSAGKLLRGIYIAVWILLFLYVYFYIDTRKFIRKMKNFVKTAGQNE